MIWFPVQHWLAVHLGIGGSPAAIFWYSFWSGFGSFVPFAVPLSVWYWHHTCHVGRCWRPARHEYAMDGVTRKLCGHHHPKVHGPLTSQQVRNHAARS